MATVSMFESLPDTLFEDILEHIVEPRHLNALSLVSRTLYHRVVPKLYHSWSYRGLEHSVASIQSFLMTILWRPDLAAHVRILDLREWSGVSGLPCPRVEDYVGYGFGPREKEKPQPSEEEIWGDDDEDDSDYYESSETDEDSASDYSDEESEPEVGEDSRPPSSFRLGPLDRDGINELLRQAADNLDIEDSEFLVNVYTAMHENTDRLLLPLVVSHLPNVRTMFLVMPEDGEWTRAGITPLAEIAKRASEDATSRVLQNLETLYICSALHIGPKGHREYELYIHYVLPFMMLRSVRSVYTLTPYGFDDAYNFPPINYRPYLNASDVTTLSFDEANLPPQDAVQAIRVPRALQKFKWAQEFQCHYTIGSCRGPFHNYIGEALQSHKQSLEILDLDIRHMYCNRDQHRGNPFATSESLRAYYRTLINPTEDPDSYTRVPQDAVLIGSLRDFVALTTLSIDATALCGHQNWSPAPIQMVDALPESLRILNLRIRVRQPDEYLGSAAVRAPELDNTFWQAHLLHLIQNARAKLPKLRKIGILVLNHSWEGLRKYMVPIGESEYGKWFQEIREECAKFGLDYSLEEESEIKTCIPYFTAQTQVRNPGRDY